MQKAVRKRGALRRSLQVPKEKKIPITFVRKIAKAEIGETVKNPTKTGKEKVRVTRKLKKRAVLALTFNKYRPKRR